MATYDSRYWLLAHVRNSFISTDDTGMCELVMLGEDLPRLLRASARAAAVAASVSAPTPSPSASDADSDFEKERVTEFDCYPDMDQTDDEDLDPLAESYDLQDDVNYVIHRQRSNTAQRLEKMEHAQKKAAKIKIIKWEGPNVAMTDTERENIFTKKEMQSEKSHGGVKVKKKSLLSEMLEKCSYLPQNQYLEYAMYDGAAQFGQQTKTFKIFMNMLPEEHRNYPIVICVIGSAKIRDLIGLICYKYSLDHPDITLSVVSSYGLFYCEDDGEVDTGLPCLDANEPCSKYGFTCLGLVELKSLSKDQNVTFTTSSIPDKGGFNVIPLTDEFKLNDLDARSRSATFDANDKNKNLDKTSNNGKNVGKNEKSTSGKVSSTVTFKEPRATMIIFDNTKFRDDRTNESSTSAPSSTGVTAPAASKWSQSWSPQEAEALKRMKKHEFAIEAPMYQSYSVQLVNKMRANTQVLLGISGEKIEIEPLGPTSNIFLSKIVKPVSYVIDNIADSELIEDKSSRTIFRLVYSRNCGANVVSPDTSSSSSSNQKSSSSNTFSFKCFEFESDHDTAREIVEKINKILELRSSVCRKEYKTMREKKRRIRRSYNLPKNV